MRHDMSPEIATKSLSALKDRKQEIISELKEIVGKQMFCYYFYGTILRLCCPFMIFAVLRIPDPNFFHPGSASKNLSILTQKIVSKLSEI